MFVIFGHQQRRTRNTLFLRYYRFDFSSWYLFVTEFAMARPKGKGIPDARGESALARLCRFEMLTAALSTTNSSSRGRNPKKQSSPQFQEYLPIFDAQAMTPITLVSTANSSPDTPSRIGNSDACLAAFAEQVSKAVNDFHSTNKFTCQQLSRPF
jgi:hypothetical protein